MMKNRLISGALALLGLLAASAASAETLRVALTCTHPPFNQRSAGGEVAGYDVDVAKGIAELMKVDLEFVCQQFTGLIPALLANKFDLIIASMSITDERLQKIDFSAPYRISVGRFIGPKARNLKLFDDAGKPIPAAFNGLKVGVERSSTYAKWIEAKLPGATIQFYDGTQAMLLDLRNGRVDIAITNPMTAYLEFLSSEEGSKYEFVSPAIDERAYFGTGVGVGLRKGQDDLKNRINAALKTLIENGSLEKYGRKYFPFSISPENWQGIGQ